MSKVKGKNTKPELQLRALLWKLGYRYRLHARDLPGSPDVVFRGRKKAIFVHGCFWHRHLGCRRTTMPSTNVQFWREKFDRNTTRDAEKEAALVAAGWSVLVVWECEFRDSSAVERRLKEFLAPSSKTAP